MFSRGFSRLLALAVDATPSSQRGPRPAPPPRTLRDELDLGHVALSTHNIKESNMIQGGESDCSADMQMPALVDAHSSLHAWDHTPSHDWTTRKGTEAAVVPVRSHVENIKEIMLLALGPCTNTSTDKHTPITNTGLDL